MNDIDNLIAQADAAASTVQQSANLPSTQTESTAVARRPSLDNLLNSGMQVDTYLKVDENGLKLDFDNKKALVNNILVTIDMREVIPTEVIKFANPAQYFKTFDGLVCADGRTRWTEALEKGVPYGATPYSSADIPMTIDEDVEANKTGSGSIVTEGQRIGYSLSTTNREAFAKFQRDINEQGLRHSKVKVKLGYEEKTNKKGNVWGIVTFELLGVSED